MEEERGAIFHFFANERKKRPNTRKRGGLSHIRSVDLFLSHSQRTHTNETHAEEEEEDKEDKEDKDKDKDNGALYLYRFVSSF